MANKTELGVDDLMKLFAIAKPRPESEMTPEEIEALAKTEVGFIHDNEAPSRANNLVDSIPYLTEEFIRRKRECPDPLHPNRP